MAIPVNVITLDQAPAVCSTQSMLYTDRLPVPPCRLLETPSQIASLGRAPTEPPSQTLLMDATVCLIGRTLAAHLVALLSGAPPASALATSLAAHERWPIPSPDPFVSRSESVTPFDVVPGGQSVSSIALSLLGPWGSSTRGVALGSPVGVWGASRKRARRTGTPGHASGLVLHVAPVPVFPSFVIIKLFQSSPSCCAVLCCGVANHQISPSVTSRPNSCGTAPVGYSCAFASADAATTHPKRTGWDPTRNSDARCALLAWLSAVHSTHKLPESAHHHGASWALSTLSLARRRTLSFSGFSAPAATLDAAERCSHHDDASSSHL